MVDPLALQPQSFVYQPPRLLAALYFGRAEYPELNQLQRPDSMPFRALSTSR